MKRKSIFLFAFAIALTSAFISNANTKRAPFSSKIVGSSTCNQETILPSGCTTSTGNVCTVNDVVYFKDAVCGAPAARP